MKVFPSKVSVTMASVFVLTLVLLISVFSVAAQTQAAGADLSGSVEDPNGAVVAGATVTARNLATGITRTVTSNSNGNYQFIALSPGEYEIITEAATFKKVSIAPVKLTVGQSAELTIKMEIGAADAVVNVEGGSVELIESGKSTVATTIDQQRIENLPINERSATGFALTISTVGRDNGRPVGPAPTSGLNIGGQRGRSTLVQVDGADFTDNSINAARSTVSQEAVQEYQVTTNSYLPEFGRASGGIVNVVTKSGTKNLHGNLFGFIRDKSIQARNAFAPVIDGDPDKKPPFTRVQYGGTIGGPIYRDRSFFFGSFEQRRRQESGFFTGDILAGDSSGRMTSSVTIGPPFLPFSQTYTGLTPVQAAYVQGTLAVNPSAAIAYAQIASAGSQTALNGSSTLVNFLPSPIPIGVGNAIGSRFLLSGAPVPLTRNSSGQFVAFRPLAQLSQIFPISEATTYTSLRFDHRLDKSSQLTLRFSYNPGRISGIQDESQNQTLGQNDFSRTGIQDTKDTAISMSIASILPRSLVNDFNLNFGKRHATFDSQIPSVAHQIAGTGFIGSNPFSPVDRVEKRYQLRDSVTWVKGSHIVKFGGDINWIDVKARFELNFPALFNFGQQAGGSLVKDPATGTACDATVIPAANRCPPFTPVQTYGLGFPSVFIQGFGNPQSSIGNTPIAFFIQDSWKIRKNFTVNFGIRYDVELTNEFAPTPFTDPLTGITLTAQDVQVAQDGLGITQGFPRDTNNWAPRAGFAWDLNGDGRTVIRGAFGLFYDHPLLAVAFNSDIADGSQQQQSTLLPAGGPSPTAIFNAFQVFQGTAIPGVTPGLAASAHYLNGFQRFDPNFFTGFGPILPFTLNVAKDFQYPDVLQGNFGIEKMIGKDMLFSASFITVNGHHLAHPQDVNIVDTNALVENFRRFAGRAPANLAEAGFFFPSSCTAAAPCPPGFSFIIPGFLAVNGLGQKIINPIAADYFRKLGPNYFFVKALTGLSKAQFDTFLPGTLRAPGPINPYADVDAQLSDGNSSYNAMNIELQKRFSNYIQFFATYTWSHTIDDSSDLQTLLKPQDNTNFPAERSDSLFDQRHRFVFSGIFTSPDKWKNGDSFHKFLYGFSVAPIVEVSSGRPFNILAVGDSNGDFQSTNERPTVLSDGRLCATGVDVGCLQGVFPANGNLGRNMGITHSFFSADLRVARRIRFGERVSLDLIGEVFNMFNRFNEAAANPFYNVVNTTGDYNAGGKYHSQSTASFDPRQFQFGFKLNF
jgi:hypothetical protein